MNALTPSRPSHILPPFPDPAMSAVWSAHSGTEAWKPIAPSVAGGGYAFVIASSETRILTCGPDVYLTNVHLLCRSADASALPQQPALASKSISGQAASLPKTLLVVGVIAGLFLMLAGLVVITFASMVGAIVTAVGFSVMILSGDLSTPPRPAPGPHYVTG